MQLPSSSIVLDRGLGALVLLDQKTASSSASLDFTGIITSAYDEYRVEFVNISVSADGASILLRCSTDNGVTFDSGANYGYVWSQANLVGSGNSGGNSGQTSITVTHAISNAATNSLNGFLRLYNPANTAQYKMTVSQTFTLKNDGNQYITEGGGRYIVTTAVNAFQILPSSGTIASGVVRVYGVSKVSATVSQAGATTSVTPAAPQGRLTTESGVPVSTSDRTAQSTIYWTPYNGNTVTLYDGANWLKLQSAEISLALSGLTSGKNYDVFLYNNNGTLALELSAAWTNDTTRADALTLQSGMYVKSGATTRLYVGTIRTTGTTTTEDSGGITGTTNVGGKRFVWNQYNQVPRTLSVIDTTTNWAYSTDSWRQARATAGNQVEVVVGNPTVVDLAITASGAHTGSGTLRIGIGVDSTTTPSGLGTSMAWNNSSFTVTGALIATYKTTQSIGYHYYAWLERGNGSVVSIFLGLSSDVQSGLTGTVLG